jgi:hypothetical protein
MAADDRFPLRTNNPETVADVVRFVGGTAAVTGVVDAGVTVSYIATGRYLLTWQANPGTFLGILPPGLQATTPADIKGHTVVAGAWDSSAFALEVDLTNASDAAHDLAALEWITVVAFFARTTAVT